MRKTVYTDVEVDVDIDLEDFDDDELIEELESRDYNVTKKAFSDSDNELQNVIDWYRRGDLKEALYQLERIVPELDGISEKIK